MSETAIQQNLQAHYTSNPKVECPKRTIAAAPDSLPTAHLYNDIDANKKMKAINNDIYQAAQKEQKSESRSFLKVFIAAVLAVLGICGIRRLMKK